MSNERAGDIIIERFDLIACSHCSQPIDTSQADPFSLIQCPSCGADMRTPARFANFILLELFGKGGMGAVYKAYDETLGRSVAIKVMQQSIGRDRAFVEQFLQEARALAAINNPHIVQIYSYGEDNGQPYIVMELVDGGRLDHIQEKNKALDERFVLQTAIEVIDGLQAAYAAGMTHGDIKPANILYDRNGSAKVADFGLARFKGEKPKPGEIWGTPYYVAPEVVKGQAPDASSDIYSLGGTLYHVLTGEPPFNGETVTDTVLLRFTEPAPDPREIKPTISDKTATILLRMLERDSFARYPTYESVRKDLTDSLSALLEKQSPKNKKSSKRSVLLPVMISLVALALIGGLIYLGVQAFKIRQIEEQKRAQHAADVAAGRLRQVMRGGQLVWVRVDTPTTAVETATAGATPAAVAAPVVNEWTLVAVADASITGDNESGEFREAATHLLLAGTEAPLEEASKIYLRFSLKDVDRARLEQAMLQLTASRRGRTKPRAPKYQMLVWALNAPQEWPMPLLWSNAPGNDPKSATEMLKTEAELLTRIDLPAHPETGDRIQVSSRPLLQFIVNYPHDELTIILTGDETTDHRQGWRFTSTQDSRFPPPTLFLKAR